VALLLNPSAGKGHALRWRAAMTQRLTDSGCRVRTLVGRNAQESADLAAGAVAAGVREVVVAGGDGLVHQVLAPVLSTDAVLGVVPVGTGNDLARELGIPAKDPLAAVDVVIGNHIRRISRVSERAAAMRWPHGQLRYTAATIAELRVLTPIRYALDLDGERRELEAVLVAVGNTKSYGGGLRMCPAAEVDDGLLDVAIIKPVSRPELVRVYPQLFSGRQASHPRYERLTARRLRLGAPGVVAYADGERLGSLPMLVEAVPAALRVFAPARTGCAASTP
jgi:diacylglycerol kinase (ATP)